MLPREEGGLRSPAQPVLGGPVGRDDEGVPGGTADAVDGRHPHACGQLVPSGPADREQPPPGGLLDPRVRHGRDHERHDERAQARQVRQQRADIDALYELVEHVDQKVDALDVKLDRRFDEISGQLSEVLRQLGGR